MNPTAIFYWTQHLDRKVWNFLFCVFFSSLLRSSTDHVLTMTEEMNGKWNSLQLWSVFDTVSQCRWKVLVYKRIHKPKLIVYYNGISTDSLYNFLYGKDSFFVIVFLFTFRNASVVCAVAEVQINIDRKSKCRQKILP